MNDSPRHVAIIMDGNGRWARRRFMPRFLGHRAGVKAARGVVQACSQKDIEALTLFAFSSENWQRPKREVSLLMDLFVSSLEREIDALHENNVRIRFIGERSAFSAKLQTLLERAESTTRTNSGLQFNVAANYGGRWDLAQAARQLAEQVADGRLRPDEITSERVGQHVCLADLPEPDLFIRTGGEQRISNFLLWQLAYTELYFTDVLWPDFDLAAFDAALADYATRQRRFGLTGEQVGRRQNNA